MDRLPLPVIIRHFIPMLLVLILLPGACSPLPPAKNNDDQITIGLEGSPTTLDPRYTTDAYGSRILPLIYNGLVTTDRHGAIVADLASSWEIIDNHTYLFRLRPTISFSDGSPCTSKDIKATIDFMRKPENGCPAYGSLNIIDSIRTPDSLTVIFQLKKPFASFLYALTSYIVPASCCQHSLTKPMNIPGTGAFRLVEFARGHQIILARNPHYDLATPHLNRICFKIITNDTTRILALKKGTVDLVQNAIPPYALKFFQRDQHLRVLSRQGSGYKYIGYNLKDPLVGNIMVRRAISLAINRRQIIRYVLKNQARPANGLLPPEHWAGNPLLRPDHFDPEKAASLLDQAGFPPQDPEGIRFSLSYKTSTNQESYEIAQIIKKQLAHIGIRIDILRFEWGTFFDDIKKGNFQLYSLKWIGIQDPDIFYYIFHSSSIPPRGANRGRFSNREMDSLLEESRTIIDLKKRRQIFFRIQQIIAEQEIYTSLWYRNDVVIMKRRLEGFEIYPGGAYTSLRKVKWQDT
ncbi:MAG: ABC transporter substrate-binding protein [Deltaproteobacteria bacterium]|nr:ABC transporter substrate-binding protein [Candidatus Tharpellaceae bacterium]